AFWHGQPPSAFASSCFAAEHEALPQQPPPGMQPPSFEAAGCRSDAGAASSAASGRSGAPRSHALAPLAITSRVMRRKVASPLPSGKRRAALEMVLRAERERNEPAAEVTAQQDVAHVGVEADARPEIDVEPAAAPEGEFRARLLVDRVAEEMGLAM